MIEINHYKLKKLEYQIADIYVRDIKSLWADYSSGSGDTRMASDFGRELGALVCVNSDYFINNATNEGLVIRNGFVLRNNPCVNADLCVIFQNGEMRCYEAKKDKVDNDEILAQYPFQSFYFGPSLLDAEGNAKTEFASPQNINGANPRTAIGYYEPGHYAFLCVLGTRSMHSLSGKNLGNGSSPGLKMAELSELCAKLGMKSAYNLDGGGSSSMYWNKNLFGHNSRATSDIIAVVDQK